MGKPEIPIFSAEKKDHRLTKRLGNGKYRVEHPPGCECQLLHTVKHARWITYDQMDGLLSCDHCGLVVDMPCPAIRYRVLSRTVKMDLAALEADLWAFQVKHEGCPPKIEELSLNGPCTHNPPTA